MVSGDDLSHDKNVCTIDVRMIKGVSTTWGIKGVVDDKSFHT